MLKAYVYPGSMAWRIGLLASAAYPATLDEFFELRKADQARLVAGEELLGPDDTESLVIWEPNLDYRSPAAVVAGLRTNFPSLLKASEGSDRLYVEWLAVALKDHPNRVINMENRGHAFASDKPIPSPYEPTLQE